MTDSIPDLSDADLESELLTWAGRVAAGAAHLLALIGEWDAREKWSGPGMGFQLVLAADRSLQVLSAQGTVIPHRPAPPTGSHLDLDPQGDVTAGTLDSNWNGDRLDLDHAVWVMLQQAA